MSSKNRQKIRNVGFLWDLGELLPPSRSKNKAAIKAAVPKDRERLKKIVVEAYLPTYLNGCGGLGKLVERKELVMI